MKVISKLYIPSSNLTSVIIPYVDNQSLAKAIVDSQNKSFEVTGVGMNPRFELSGVTDLHVKGKFDDNEINSIEYRH